MKIQTKLTALAIIAFLLPLIGAIVYLRNTARSYYEKQLGVLYLTIAKDMEDALDRDVLGQMRTLGSWVGLFGIADELAVNGDQPIDRTAVAAIESKWASLKPGDEPLRSILENSMAAQLIRFQRLNPLFEELILTDRKGRLVAATNPTSDYWQADEEWWINASRGNGIAAGWSHNIVYDASAGVQAMDIALPVRNEEGELLGIVKGSLNAIEVLRRLAPDPWNAEIMRDILFQDGRLFARLNPEEGATALRERVAPDVLSRLIAGRVECQIVDLFEGTPSLAVCVPVGMLMDQEARVGQAPVIFVLVHREYAKAMAPMTGVIRELTWQGGLLVLVIAGMGYLFSTAWFAQPLSRLRKAALCMEAHVRHQEEGRSEALHRSLREVELALVSLNTIRTRDEMQELAEVFSHMGTRVLNFHRQLERELIRATEEINEDLVMAREFQEALLPDRYPRLSVPAGADAFNLTFSHIYRPAKSVSGDFFDISEVSKHSVRLVIADVMGHGARSALMTAILHALISDTAKDDDDPVPLLQRMNEEFYAIGQRTGDTLFVTAVHMIVDTQRRLIRYAVAGHPSPLVIDPASREIKPLPGLETPLPAAGLFRDSVYSGMQYHIDRPQTLLLFTDGVTEAVNMKSEEFGYDRFVHAIRNHMEEGFPGCLPEYVLGSLEAFMGPAVSLDDICLVSVDIHEAAKR